MEKMLKEKQEPIQTKIKIGKQYFDKDRKLSKEIKNIKLIYMKGVKDGIAKGIEKGIKKGKEERIKLGIAKGKQEGIQKGMEKKQKQIVLNMYREKVKTEDICRFMKLTIEEVDDIIIEM